MGDRRCGHRDAEQRKWKSIERGKRYDHSGASNEHSAPLFLVYEEEIKVTRSDMDNISSRMKMTNCPSGSFPRVWKA